MLTMMAFCAVSLLDGADPALPRDLGAEIVPAGSASSAGLAFRSAHSAFVFTVGVEADARASLPVGILGEDRIITPAGTLTASDHLSYSRLFHAGLGVALEASLLFEADRQGGRPSDIPAVGPYGAVHWDRFGGGSEEDELGTTIDPDALEVTTILAGVRGEGAIEGPFWGSLRFGLGAAHYDSVHARFRTPGGSDFRGEMIDETWTFAMEVRLHFGWRAGPLGLSFGFGARVMGGPHDGDAMDFHPGIIVLLDFDLGAELRF